MTDIRYKKDARHWLRLWPGMQDEAVFLTDGEIITALGLYRLDEEVILIENAVIGDWVCDGDGYYIRLSGGPLFGNYLVPR